MRYQVLILLPLLAAALDVFGLLSTTPGRLVVLAVLLVGLWAAVNRPGFRVTARLVRSAAISGAAALVTFLLSTRLELGAVVASGLVGLLGAQVLKDRDQLVMYLGAFVGMSCPRCGSLP